MGIYCLRKKNEQLRLKTLIWQLTRRLRVLSFTVLGALALLNTAFYLRGTHQAACSVIESQFKNLVGPLSRELVLGNKEGANLLFTELVRHLESLNQSTSLQLNTGTEAEGNPSCSAHFLHSTVFLPVRLGGDTLGIIEGKLSYFSLFHLVALFVALFISTWFGTKILCNFLAKGLEKSLVRPIRQISRGHVLRDKEDVPKEVLEIEQNLENLKLSYQKMERQAFELLKAREWGEQAERLSHDIISPLNAIHSTVQEIGEINSKQKQTMELALNRLREITQGLLQRGSDQEHRKTKPKQDTLKVFLEGLVAEKEAEEVLQKNVDFTVRLEGNLDEEIPSRISKELGRLLSNLINNSRDAIATKGNIEITASLMNELLTIEIKDNGKGIPTEVIPRLMVKGASFDKPSGSGLGLYYAKKMMDVWGGRIEIASEIGQGTQVRLSLPLKPNTSGLLKVDTVLIDDDELTRRVWESAAQNDGIALLTFSSPLEFFKVSKELPKNISIYIDSDLGGPIRGEYVARDISEQGFSQISLTTGFDKTGVTHTPWICEVLPKMPTWHL